MGVQFLMIKNKKGFIEVFAFTVSKFLNKHGTKNTHASLCKFPFQW